MKTKIKYIISFVLIISMFSHSLKFSYLVYEYTTNNKVFTEKYCKNKVKPELKCNGKCELKKISAEKENQESSKKTVENSEIVFLDSYQEYNFFRISLKEKKLIFAKKDCFKSDTFHQIEHPPQNFI